MIIDEKNETNNDGSLIPVDDTMNDSDDLIIEFNVTWGKILEDLIFAIRPKMA